VPIAALVRGARAIGAVVIVAVSLLDGAVSADAATSVAGHLRYAIDNNPNFSNLSQTAQRNEYVILKPSMTAQAQQLKSSNPGVTVLMYKNLSASIDYPSNAYLTTGVSHDEADSQHPEWFLLNTSGQRFTHRDYSFLWAMDVGSPSYQQRWAENVLASLDQLGFDGVFIDDTNPTMKGHYDPSKVAKYPSDSAYQQATESALAYITPRIHSAGYKVVANIGHWGEYPDAGRSWLRYLDGAMDENFGKWGNTAGSGYAWEGYWNNELGSLKYAQQQGKDYLAVTHSADNDAAAARYGWATVLLGAAGNAQFALHSNYTTEPWFPEYEYEIGQPAGPEIQLPNGVHLRVFTNGIVVVNPTTNQLSADLCGGAYSGSGHSHVTSLQLGANSAAIMTLDSGSASASCEVGGGSTGDDTGSGGETTVEPGSKGVKKGKVVAKGRVMVSGDQTALASSADNGSVNPVKGADLHLEVSRRGGGAKTTAVGIRDDGRFVARVRVCQPGSYEVVALEPGTGERRSWPGRLRVREKQLHC
jgi:hypothetical protein